MLAITHLESSNNLHDLGGFPAKCLVGIATVYRFELLCKAYQDEHVIPGSNAISLATFAIELLIDFLRSCINLPGHLARKCRG